MTKLVELDDQVLKPIKATTIEKIMKVGILTVQDLAIQMPKKLAEKAGMGLDTATNAIDKALTYTRSGLISGADLHKEQSKRTRLSTGAAEFDKLLTTKKEWDEFQRGGVLSEAVLEIIGEKGTGKTQICFMLAIRAQFPIEEGGLGGEVIWIDTEGTFFASRIIEICEALELDAAEVLSKIWVGSAVTTQDQKRLVDEASSVCHEKNIKLIIVDSMMGHLRSEYIGRGMLSARQDELKLILHKLKHTCWIHKITGVYTNQVQDDPGKMYGDPLKPIGGHVMGHSPTYRVQLRRGKGPLRIVAMKKSADLPDGEARFKVTERGIEDVE